MDRYTCNFLIQFLFLTPITHLDRGRSETGEDQRNYASQMMERTEAVMRGSPVRDLLCALWRGRAEANSPILRLDESTVNAGRQKSKEGKKMVQHKMAKKEFNEKQG